MIAVIPRDSINPNSNRKGSKGFLQNVRGSVAQLFRVDSSGSFRGSGLATSSKSRRPKGLRMSVNASDLHASDNSNDFSKIRGAASFQFKRPSSIRTSLGPNSRKKSRTVQRVGTPMASDIRQVKSSDKRDSVISARLDKRDSVISSLGLRRESTMSSHRRESAISSQGGGRRDSELSINARLSATRHLQTDPQKQLKQAKNQKMSVGRRMRSDSIVAESPSAFVRARSGSAVNDPRASVSQKFSPVEDTRRLSPTNFNQHENDQDLFAIQDDDDDGDD